MQLCHAFPAALGRGRRGEPNKADGRSSEQTKTSQKVSARTRGRGGHSGWGSLCRRNARRPNNSSLAALFQGFLGSKQQRLRRPSRGRPRRSLLRIIIRQCETGSPQGAMGVVQCACGDGFAPISSSRCTPNAAVSAGKWRWSSASSTTPP